MTGRSRAAPPSGGLGTTALLAGILGFLGLLGALPAFLGPAIGVVGAVGSYVLRRTGRGGADVLALAPSLLALAILTAAAPAGPGPELFAGLGALALLLWIADDPGRPSGATRRALPTVAPAALGVAFAWALSLGLPGQEANVGLAGSLIAGALVVLAFLLGNLSAPTGAAAPLKRRAASEPWDPR